MSQIQKFRVAAKMSQPVIDEEGNEYKYEMVDLLVKQENVARYFAFVEQYEGDDLANDLLITDIVKDFEETNIFTS